MAKAIISAKSDLSELVTDLLMLADEFPEVIKIAANEQLSVFSNAIKMNWASMIPWGHVNDYVYDSIGHNVSWGNNTSNDVVGMAGVFLVDSVAAKHNKGKGDIKAPQLAYWAEFGVKPNNGHTYVGIPFMSNAYYATLSEQDEIFADTLSTSIKKRLSK